MRNFHGFCSLDSDQAISIGCVDGWLKVYGNKPGRAFFSFEHGVEHEITALHFSVAHELELWLEDLELWHTLPRQCREKVFAFLRHYKVLNRRVQPSHKRQNWRV